MSTLQVSNVHLESTGNNRVQYAGSNTVSVFTAGSQRALFDGTYLRLAGGIQFNNDTLAANALQDYEEGTFTPAVAGDSVAGAGTYTGQTGKYVKVGKMVYASVYLSWSAHTGTGNMTVTGLPFVSDSSGVFNIGYQTLTVPASSLPKAYIGSSSSTILFVQAATGPGGDGLLAMDTAATLDFSIMYRSTT